MLKIEYHHLKACIGASSIQAIVERALSQGMGQPEPPEYNDHRPSVLPDDRKFIDQTISASCRVLEMATDMQVEGVLRYTPLRIRNCFISASILLLKAIRLGGRSYMLRVAMGKLDQCIAALRSCSIDDLDFLPRYAELVNQHLPRFRDQLNLPQGCDENQPSGTPAANKPSEDVRVIPPWNPKIAPCPPDSKANPLGVGLHSPEFLCHPSEFDGN